MPVFRIGGTDFGIDAGKSRFGVSHSAGGDPFLDIEIEGNEQEFEKVSEEEERAWALYPPQFYCGFPTSTVQSGKKSEIRLTAGDLEGSILRFT
jgi:hypothetical protein